MTLTYDFDMFSNTPEDVETEVRGSTKEPGIPSTFQDQQALFRDPAAVAALEGASEEVKKCLLDSGFRFGVFDSGAGPGRYPASDSPARAQVIERLMENLENLPEGMDWNGFDIEAFAMAALVAKPCDLPAHSQNEMRGRAESPEPGPSAPPVPERGAPSSMDAFFSNQPQSQQSPGPSAQPDMDTFFSNTGTSAKASQQSSAPDMDTFFSDAKRAGSSSVTPHQMSADDIRSTIETAPPKKIGFGPVKMVLMALGLFAVISLLGNGAGGNKLIELATGGKMVSIGR